MKPTKAFRGLLEILARAGLSILRGVLGLVLLLAGAWSVGAIEFSGLASPLVRGLAAVAFGIWTLAAFGAVGQRWKVVARYVVGVAVLIGLWSLKTPSTERNFPPETSKLASASVAGDHVTVHNVRNFHYRSTTDFDPRWEDRTYVLSRLKTVDFIVSHWSGEAIAQTILSFVFEGGDYLAVSVEIRRREDQEYSVLAGVYKQYTLIYVWADERDVIRLRTNFRGEDVYVYPTVADPPGSRKMLLSMLERTNGLQRKPVWYSTLGQNCTTTLVDHVNEIMPGAIP